MLTDAEKEKPSNILMMKIFEERYILSRIPAIARSFTSRLKVLKNV